MAVDHQYRGIVANFGTANSQFGERMYIDISPPNKNIVRIFTAKGLLEIFKIRPLVIGEYISLMLTHRGGPAAPHRFSIRFYNKDRTCNAFLFNPENDPTSVAGKITIMGYENNINTSAMPYANIRPPEPKPEVTEPSLTAVVNTPPVASRKRGPNGANTFTSGITVKAGDKLKAQGPSFHKQTGLWRLILQVGEDGKPYTPGFKTEEEAEAFKKHFKLFFLGGKW
jgi:hypothetical protein